MKDKEWLSCIGVITLGLLVTIVSVILNAWALKTLWGWFLVPFGLPSLTIVSAAGINLIVGFLIRRAVKIDDDVDWYKPFATAFLPPLFSVLMGWILLLFA